MTGQQEKGTHEPAETTKNDERLGSPFTYQEKRNFGFLIPHDDANSCPLA